MEMKICAAQTRPVKGDIQANIGAHKKLVELAVSNGAEMIFFPELSLTSYEPKLAKELAVSQDDERFGDFQKIADARQVIVGVGVPTNSQAGVCISMILFQPHKERQTHSKKHLHPDEEPYFTSGQNSSSLAGGKCKVAIAICHELTVPEHSDNARESGADVYAASVAKHAGGVEKAAETLAGIARKHSMSVLMSNCLGPCGDFESAGKTSIWNSTGLLAGQLDGEKEGVLIFDTDTQEVVEKYAAGQEN